MKVEEMIASVKDTASVRRVFADPIERDGVVIVPVAAIGGGLGVGHGHDKAGQEGEGGGFGVGAKPAGVYELRDGRVRWIPAVDVNRLLALVGGVLVAFVVSRVRVAKFKAFARQPE